MLEIEETSRRPHPELQWQNRAIREGRGLGRGADYQPFIQVRRQDFPSHGLSQIVRNPLLGREHHFLSVLEYQIALRVLHCGAIDLREQFPLRLEDDDIEYAGDSEYPAGTVALARRLGIRHPQITSQAPRVLSTDMVITGEDGLEYAIFVRYAKDMPAPGSRQSQLLQLQREYWTDRSVKFVILTDKDIDPALTRLLVWAQEGLSSTAGGTSAQFLTYLRGCDSEAPLRAVLSRWSEGFEAALARFRTAVFRGHVTVRTPGRVFPTLNQPWDFRVSDAAHRTRALREFLGRTGHG